ncbi:hypothetical protein ACLK1T_07630 [Escherichia coli]
MISRRVNASQNCRSAKDDICYATTNRQEAVRPCDNRRKLCWWRFPKTSPTPTAWWSWPSDGKRAFLIDDTKDIQEEWVKEVKCVGVTAVQRLWSILVENAVARRSSWAVVKRFRWKAVKKTLF